MVKNQHDEKIASCFANSSVKVDETKFPYFRIGRTMYKVDNSD